MGIWGVGLYDNDCTLDIRDEFQYLISNGYLPCAAAKKVRQQFADMFLDAEDGHLCELALRERLFLCGALKEPERVEIITYLQNGGDVISWKTHRPEMAEKRADELKRLVNLFCSPSPRTCKKVNGIIKMKFHWSPGQIFAIPITDDAHPEYHGEFILIYICGEAPKVDRYLIPEVYVKLTKGGKLPKNSHEFNSLDFVQIGCTAMKDRFRPFKKYEDVPVEYRQEYCPDPWGYLPEYSMIIYEAAGNHPPDSMIYLGCWENILPPAYNYRKYPVLNGAAWDHLQSFVLQRFCLHNLRQASFYK